MGRLGNVVVAALAVTLTTAPGTASAIATPPTTPPPASPSTQGDGPARTTQPDQRPRRTTTTSTRPAIGSVNDQNDDGSWSVTRIAVTGAIAIAGLALIGWAVARVRNALARPSVR